ncbi:MAG TPA: radical SAM protein, partial [Stellaceae bacterium]
MPSTRPAELDPRRYFAHIAAERGPVAQAEPVCLYLETTNRCNLLCTTCPRTFEALEPAGDMSWELFTSIVDQFPNIARVVLHGVGEPMMVPSLPRMIRYLKERGSYVLFNTNGTLLSAKKGRELIDSGLDELRVSLDAAEPAAFKLVRGRDMFRRIVRNVRAFRAMQAELGAEMPRVSLWLTGLKETVDQLGDFVRLAHQIDVPEVYLQRLVYFPEGQGLAREQSALFAGGEDEEGRKIREAEELAAGLGISFNASGATDPATSLKREADQRHPWS